MLTAEQRRQIAARLDELEAGIAELGRRVDDLKAEQGAARDDAEPSTLLKGRA